MKNLAKSALGVAAIAAAFLHAEEAEAGAWTAQQGDSYNKFAVNYFRSDNAFGERPGFENFEEANFTYYGEYGITNDVTFIATVPFRYVETTNFGQTIRNGGVGDAEIGLRYNFFNKPFVASAQFLFKAPYFYNEDNPLPLGNGQEDFELRLLAGKSFGKFGYFGAEVGYRFRLDAPSDEFRYLIEYGVDATDKIYLRSKLDTIVAIESTAAGVDLQTGNPALPLAFNLGRVETTAGYRINKRFSAEFTATTNPFGENIIRGVNYQLALIAAF